MPRAEKRQKTRKRFDFEAALARVDDDPHSTYARILGAAEILFAERGFAGVGIRDIADAVGINVSTLHFHWRNKAILYEAVCRSQTALIGRTLREALGDGPFTPEILEGAVQAMIGVLAENPCIAPMILHSVKDQELPELEGVKRFDVGLFETLAQQLKGVSGPGSVAREFPDLTFLMLYHALVLLFADGAPQKALLGASLYKSRALQKRIGAFASRLVEQVSCE